MATKGEQGWRLILFGLALAVLVMLFGRWREATRRGGQDLADPFKVAGNLYFVGGSYIATFLITGPDGHVLVDAGTPGTPHQVTASIRKLGFDPKDVKVLISTDPHEEHAGGLAELQDSTGAKLWASALDADVLENGGAGDPSMGNFRILTHTPLMGYEGPRVDHRVKDGDTVRLGATTLVAHATPGHTPGCLSWTFTVREGDRDLRVVHRCSLELSTSISGSLKTYPAVVTDFERTFSTLRALPVDIWVTTHGGDFGRYRKYRKRDSVPDPVTPFLDSAGYFAKIDSAEAKLRAKVAEMEKAKGGK